MTGDGVNDVLALKDADCSVAMASGSDAAAQAAQLVLLDNDFSKMPSVVLEGRRVVNNLQRSGTLFLVKNIFSFLLSIFSLISMVTYPLEPSQISLISMFTIGIPGFLLSLMPNKNRIEGHFITNILTRAPACGADRLFDGRNTRRLRPGICGRLGRYFDRCHRTARHCRFYDSLPDQQAAQLDALDDPDRLDYCLHFLQYLSEPAVRHF